MITTNNKVLITGGSSGIGLAIARKFKELDNEVIITGRDQAKLEKVAKKHGFECINCDLSDNNGANALVDIIKKHHPDLNIFINNAGVQFNYSFLEPVDYEKIEQEIQVNLIAPINLCAALIPILNNNENAALVNVSSGLALSPKQSAPVYCGTKAALHIFTKALRYQLENSTIKVFEIIPPLVDTPMTEGRGTKKMTPEQLTNEFMRNFKRDRLEINIGKVKLLRLIHRISPRIADGILKNN